jgi:hypothetical protein
MNMIESANREILSPITQKEPALQGLASPPDLKEETEPSDAAATGLVATNIEDMQVIRQILQERADQIWGTASRSTCRPYASLMHTDLTSRAQAQ